MTPRQVWQAALAELQGTMTPATFETWVKNTVAADALGAAEPGWFTIAAPNTFAKEWLDTRFRRQIETTLARILGHPTRLEVVVEGFGRPSDGPAKPRRRAETPGQTALIDGVGEGEPTDAPPSRPVRPARSPDPSLRSRTGPSLRPRTGRGPLHPAPTQRVPASGYPAPEEGTTGRRPSTPSPQPSARGDERWTFDTFIVGPSNRFAFAAAKAVADEPAAVYNPLFIHGGVGLGKTHLLQAIAQTAAAKGLKVLYVTCEQFTNDLIDAIQRRQTDAFRTAYRSNDVLLIDDIQFLAGKESTQDEFFHTFNELHGAQGQIVISSDRPPRAIATLEQRLTSRFEWGLIVDIQPPDLETRTAILRARAVRQPIPVPADVIALLAARIQRNVRELEGALTTVVAYAKLNGAPLTVETAQKALAEVTTGRARPIQPAEVLDAVARHYKVDPKLLRGKQRDREIVVPRQVAMYLMREETTASLLEIGRELGGRDHTTVLHGWEKIRREVEVDDGLRRDVLTIRERLLAEGY
ncbi:MAG TPA: chromosomal replication initiator protein DnaA [Chloroflexota bacterium]|jgi:chromosomal replication initiator protein|nr:chromosomal replication initiator protein DnaA [Chloroflexota bacterium]